MSEHTPQRTEAQYPRPRWYNSLRFRLYFGFALLLAVLLAASFFIVLKSSRTILQEDAYRSMDQTAETITALTGKDLAYAEALLYSLRASADEFMEDPEAPTDAVTQMLRAEAHESCLDGADLWFPEPGDGYRAWLWRREGGEALELVRRDGAPIEAPGEAWFVFARTIEPGRAYWTGPRVDPRNGAQVVTCATSFENEDGRRGVSAVHVDVTFLRAALRAGIPDTAHSFFLVDREDRFIYVPPGLAWVGPAAGSDPSLDEAFPRAEDLSEEIPQFEPIARVLARINADITSRVRWQMRSQEGRVERLQRAGATSSEHGPPYLDLAMLLDSLVVETQLTPLLERKVIPHDPSIDAMAVLSVYHLPKTYWKLGIIAPRNAVTARGRSIAFGAFMFLAAVVGGCLLIVLYMYRRDVIGPVRNMSRYLMGLTETEGDFLQGLGNRTPNELVELAAAFDNRTTALREANVLLRQENEVRERAEKALRQSEARFRNVLENTRDMLYKLNLERKRYEYVSPAAFEVTGFTAEEVIGMGGEAVAERIHPDDRAAMAEHFRRLRGAEEHSETSSQVTYRWMNQAGEYVWLSENRTLLFEQGGAKPTAIVGSARDVTQRKRNEEEMTRMRHYLRNIIDSMPSTLIGVDRDGLVTHWNQSAADDAGLAAEEAYGQPFFQVYPLLREQTEKVLDAICDQRTINSERFVVDTGDEVKRYDLTVYPLVADGVQGAVIRVDDVTTRVQTEEMLVQTEKMMSVGGLAAGMAHEINNPLGGILQACQNINRRTSPELPKNRQVAEELGLSMEALHAYMEQRGITDFIDGIREDGKRAAKIIADMLAFSRRSESRFAPAELSELVDTVIRLAANDYDLKKHYDFKRLKVETRFGDVPPIRCDKTKIEQVLLNLVKNAAQAMGDNPRQERQPTLVIETVQENGYARIEVADNGPGMDESVRKRVFEPFFTTKEVGIGTGLGLSVSYFIVTKQHRGEMSVDSTPGQGTKFTIRLPLEPDEEADE